METLKNLRNQKGLTQKQVAKELNIPMSTYACYEQGIRTIDIRYIIPLSNIFDCSADEIISAQINSINIRPSDKIVS